MHAVLIGACTFLACWGCASALLHAGVASLPMRHAGALIGGHVAHLLLPGMWSRRLLGRDDPRDAANGIETIDAWSPGGGRPAASPVFRSGDGGDSGGGGATGDWSGATASSGSEGVSEGVGRGASGAMDAIGSADEGCVVAIPLVIAVGIAMLLAAAFGCVVVGLFGVEVLVGVAVGIAFASAGGASRSGRAARVGCAMPSGARPARWPRCWWPACWPAWRSPTGFPRPGRFPTPSGSRPPRCVRDRGDAPRGRSRKHGFDAPPDRVHTGLATSKPRRPR